MAYTLEQIEYLHNRGLMPDWIYYQQNGKSAQANYNEQKLKFAEECRRHKIERQRKEEEKALEAEMEKQVEKALNELLKDFGK